MELFHLLYVSSAAKGVGLEVLREIQQSAESQNADSGITGALVYGRGEFLQVLEGERREVSQTYNRIARDPRHLDLELIVVSPIPSRAFASWEMCCVPLDEDQSSKQSGVIRSLTGSAEFTPRKWDGAVAHNVLLEIAKGSVVTNREHP
jgi:hypothetical protein